uniref:DUF547 domain-containing protein n=1 Tax=Craspedostauros australis TaxID=1486917 RepID=A0A7R9ZL02_9STRA|mmetsp:Transcript_19280/g.53624  ORF Transcript_19280/g.53624 Transcript_19280/m.53624 type:complete len:338 (+) Transcript_19280:265-1278(+)
MKWIANLWQPVLYRIEKAVSEQSIPKTNDIKGRFTWDDLAQDDADEAQTNDAKATSSFDHSLWNQVLQRHVHATPGRQVGTVQHLHTVDYEGIRKDPDFQAYLDKLKSMNQSPDIVLSRRHRLAFWMNVYNAFCISLLLQQDALPARILDLSASNDPVWDRVAGVVAGASFSLNQIEHDKLRKQFAIAEVHSCIVCASASCPDLRNEAFVGTAQLKLQMADQMKLWLLSTSKGMRVEDGTVTLSRIFLWFRDDFVGTRPGIEQESSGETTKVLKTAPSWLAASDYIPGTDSTGKDDDEAGKLRAMLRSQRTAIRYFEYDWSINDVANSTVIDGDASK